MRLDQYDRLEQNIRKSVKYILDLKSENNKLKKEVEKLKQQLETTSERGIKKLNNSNIESTLGEKLPGKKTETIVAQLDEVIKKMKSFTTGVEF